MPSVFASPILGERMIERRALAHDELRTPVECGAHLTIVQTPRHDPNTSRTPLRVPGLLPVLRSPRLWLVRAAWRGLLALLFRHS